MGTQTTSTAVSGEIGGIARHDAHACEEEYDDEKDHTRCCDCKGSGWYIGFTERRFCPTCDGSGFL
jgi:hypothetical protein